MISAPTASHITVAEAPDRTTIVITAPAWDRWVDGSLALAYLFIWWLPVVVVVNTLLSTTSLPWRLPAPEVLARDWADSSNAPPPWVVPVLIVLVVVLTLIGFRLLSSVLRAWCGSDRFVLEGGRFSSRRAIGPLGRLRIFQPQDIAWIAVQRARAVCLQVGAAEVRIATLGTEADRRWLAELLRTRYGLKTRSEQAAGAPPVGWAVVKGWNVVRLTEPLADRRARMGCFGVVAVLWWLLIAAGVYVRLSTPGPLIGLAVGAVIGLLFSLLTFWGSRAHVTLDVGPNHLVRETNFVFWKPREVFTSSALRITHHVRGKSLSDYFLLEVHAGGAWRTVLGSSEAAEILAMGRYLGRQTGWRLDVAEQAKDLI